MISDIISPNCVKLPNSERITSFISIHTAKKGVHKKQAKQAWQGPFCWSIGG